MAVVYKNLENNMVLAYSDEGFMIHGGSPESDYETAIDPKALNRTYTETDVKISKDTETDVQEMIMSL